MSESPAFPPNLALLVSIIAVSTASILIRMSGAPPLAIASYRLLFTTLILLPFYLHSGGGGRLIGAKRRDILTLFAVGVVLALHFASWITSLSLTSVASSVIFVHIDPIFVAAMSHFVLKERIGKGTLMGIFVAFVGATVIALGDAGSGRESLLGDLLALVGAMMLGLYLLAGRRLRQNLDLVSYVTPVYATSAFTLVLGSLLTGTRLAPYPLYEYLLFLAIAVVPMIFGHTVYNWALRYIEAPVVSISLLGEPVGATILAYVFLGESPPPITLLGGAVTLLGIYLCMKASD
ncbi:MAG: DMT family transporter [Candidatus Bathyarchaeota archaeon]|jgi:drug/metabolite transporter (DMT)-like permease